MPMRSLHRRDDGTYCGSGGGSNAYIRLRVASIFILIATSMFGALVPVVARRVQWLRALVPTAAFQVVKYFGSGVIHGDLPLFYDNRLACPYAAALEADETYCVWHTLGKTASAGVHSALTERPDCTGASRPRTATRRTHRLADILKAASMSLVADMLTFHAHVPVPALETFLP